MEFVTHYIKPGLTMLVYACVAYSALMCGFWVFHFVKLQDIKKRIGGGLSSSACVGMKMKIRRDKRHIIMTAMAIFAIFVCFQVIAFLRK